MVIDGDNQKMIERFNGEDIEERLDWYRSLGRWGCVDKDCNGDIILWEEE